MPTTVFTHKNCQDGMASAWVAWKYFGGPENGTHLEYVSYDHALPEDNLDSKTTVYLLDMSRPIETLLNLATRVNRIVEIDHHESALVDAIQHLSTLSREDALDRICQFRADETTVTEFLDFLESVESPASTEMIEDYIDQSGMKQLHLYWDEPDRMLSVRLDLRRCGAYLAWENFFQDQPPRLLSYVDTRDRWVWERPKAEELTEALFTRWYAHVANPPSLVSKEELHSALHGAQWFDEIIRDPSHISQLIAEGEPDVHQRRAEVEEIIRGVEPIWITQESVPCVRAERHRSWVGHTLLDRFKTAYAVSWRHKGNAEDPIDFRINAAPGYRANRIAAKFQGGGHPGAAGFSLQRLSRIQVGERFLIPKISGNIQEGIRELEPGTQMYCKVSDQDGSFYGAIESNPYVTRLKDQ